MKRSPKADWHRQGIPVLWIYERLMHRYGPQGWWPVTPDGGSEPVYAEAYTRGSLAEPQKFEMVLGAILTQNTAWTNVEKALVLLRKSGVTTPQRLLRKSSKDLYRLIRSSGYYRQKAKRLKIFCRYLVKKSQGQVGRLLCPPTEKARTELLGVPGIGPETADSILLYAGQHCVFVVDAYTRRIGERFGLFRNLSYDNIQYCFQGDMKPSLYVYREYHALLVSLAKGHCLKIPQCDGCPLLSRCRTGQRNI